MNPNNQEIQKEGTRLADENMGDKKKDLKEVEKQKNDLRKVLQEIKGIMQDTENRPNFDDIIKDIGSCIQKG